MTARTVWISPRTVWIGTLAYIALVLMAHSAFAQGRSMTCVLWPRSAACQPSPPQIIYVPVPAPPVSPPPPAAAPQPPAAKPVTPAPRIKARPPRSSFVKPLRDGKRKAAARLPEWCARIPATATQGQAEVAAPIFIGRELTAAEKRQVAACIASKRG